MTYRTRDLTPETWPAFERLFRPGTGWAFCACMLYQRGCHLPSVGYPTRKAARTENQRQKRELVEAGRAHGVLVFDDDDDPIGWCQFGPAEELPIPAATRLDRRIPPLADDVDWRITCFVTAARHRRQGVATVALGHALDAIATRGGGVTEGYPTTRPANSDWAHRGTAAMFETAGFRLQQRMDQPYVVMRRTIADRAERSK